MTVKSIRDLLPQVVQRAAVAAQAAKQLREAWPKLVGNELARHTRPAGFRRKVLCVYTDDPGASFLLALEKPRLLAKLRALADTEIEDIVIRPGDPGESLGSPAAKHRRAPSGYRPARKIRGAS